MDFPWECTSVCFSSSVVCKYSVVSGPWQRNFVDACFFSSTCFRPSGAAQQQLGFRNFTSGSIWKWCLQWHNSGSQIERSVAHGTPISAPRYASAWKQRKRRWVRGVVCERSVQKYNNGCTQVVLEEKKALSLPLLVYSLVVFISIQSWWIQNVLNMLRLQPTLQ